MSIPMKQPSNTINHPGGPLAEPDWAELLAKTVDDLSVIAKTEIELLEALLKRIIAAQGERLVGIIIMLVALSYGSLLLLGGVVLLIHLWLAWWLSLLITGAALVIAGVGAQMAMFAAARKSAV
jgi:hypothetical protein